LAIFGNPADYNPITGGGGSGAVTPYYMVTPYAGVNAVLNAATPRPINCTMETNIDYYQAGSPSASSSGPNDCCQQCTSRLSCNAWTYYAGYCYFKPDNSGRTSKTGATSGSCAPVPKGAVNITYYTGTDLNYASQLAASVDAAIAVLATTSSEGSDRPNLQLPADQVNLATAMGNSNPNSVALVITPGAVLVPFATSVSAVVLMFLPGQEEGNSFADVLFGNVNPSGKLPVTLPNVDNEVGFSTAQYPGINNEGSYSELLNVGYRWYAANKVTPKFPFGHGLSYTTFTYSNLKINGRTISADITNSGPVAGAEVPQLYLNFPASAGEPPIQLKGFQKIQLSPGAKQTASWVLSDRDLSIWDANAHKWAVQSGNFGVLVGASSQDIRLQGTLVN